MNYIYDILLNFTNPKKFYDFFEWELNDTIVNIKKIPVFKISKEMMWDLLHYKLKLDEKFLKKIANVAIIYKQNKNKFKNLAVMSDGAKSIGISINNSGIIDYKSAMLLDEEEEATFIADKMPIENISYKKLEKYEKDEFSTRKEEEEKEFLKKEINFLYKEKEFEKLKYLYIEYFDKKEDCVEIIYKNLLESLNNMDNRHEKIYKLLKLACKR